MGEVPNFARESKGHGSYWRGRAVDNVEEWGLQDVDTLLLATLEELGELTRAHLEAQHEGADGIETYKEIDDLAPLMWQLMWALTEEYEER